MPKMRRSRQKKGESQQMNRNQFLIALEEYWRKRDSADNDWMDVEVNTIDLFDACQKLGFFNPIKWKCLFGFHSHWGSWGPEHKYQIFTMSDIFKKPRSIHAIECLWCGKVTIR